MQRLVTHDQMTRLIFLCQFLASFSFLTKCNSSHLKTLLRFCMEMFKYSEFGLEWTTAKSTIMFTFFSIFALDRRCPSPQSNSFVLIALSFLLQLTKLVIGLSKSVMGAAIKYTGHPGRRFLAASPLVFAASPLHSRSKNSLNRQATQAIVK